MSPPSEQQRLAALAALSGANPELPDDALRRDLLQLQLIGEALGRGITWAQIGQALGYGGPKSAKAACKRLQRRVRREALKAGADA